LKTPTLSFLGLGTLCLTGLTIGVCMMFTAEEEAFVFFGRGTIMTVLPGLVALQNVLVAKGTPAPFDGTDKVTSPQMRNGVMCRESFFL
jgi:hypothetical protein